MPINPFVSRPRSGQGPRRWLYRTKAFASLTSVVLLVLTLIDPQWVEHRVGESPDSGDGNAERLVLAACFALAATLAAALARRERLRSELS
jgi:hypothetical protein